MCRFQNQPWYIKLWRYRFYLTIPLDTLNLRREGETSIKNCFSLAKGLAQTKMKWYYSWDEVEKWLGHKIEKYKK